MKRLWNFCCSIPGLIIMATLAAIITIDNVHAIMPCFNSPASTVAINTDIPPKPDLKELGKRVKAAFPAAYDDLEDAELGRRVVAKYPAIYEGVPNNPSDFAARLNALRSNATALCNDGTYSYSGTPSGTCSGHNGVAKWLHPVDR